MCGLEISKQTYTPYVILTGDINIDFLQLTNSQLRDCLSLFILTNILDEPNLTGRVLLMSLFFSVDEACEHFSSKFMEFCKACIWSRNVLIRENDKPWFTSEILYNIRLRDRLRKMFLKSGRIADLSYKRQHEKIC